jgi:hypothetical protein
LWKSGKKRTAHFFQSTTPVAGRLDMGLPIYNTFTSVPMGIWNPYTAVAGHEAPVKATLASSLPGGFSSTNYNDQYKQILGEAARLESDPIYGSMYIRANSVRDDWNRYGTGSDADPSHGSVSFTDHPFNDGIGGPQWTCTTHPFTFESGSVPSPIIYYSILTIFK